MNDSKATSHPRGQSTPEWTRAMVLYLSAISLAFILGCPAAPVSGNGNDDPSSPSVEIGYTDETGTSYEAITSGGVMPLFTSGQGGSHMFVTIRADGFPVDASGRAVIALAQRATLATDDRVLNQFTQVVEFFQLDDNTIELVSRIVIFSARPEDVDGQIIDVEFTLTLVDDPTITATVSQSIEMELQ